MPEPLIVYPHEFFRLDFDKLLEESTRQESLLSVNAGEGDEVKKLHDWWDCEVLPLVLQDDWVYEGARRFAVDLADGCFDQMAETNHAVYPVQQKLLELKEEVIEFLGRAAIRGWTKHTEEDYVFALEKPSDFIHEIKTKRVNDRAAFIQVQRLKQQAHEHERKQARVIMTATRDLYTHVFPAIMFVAKRAIAVRAGLDRSAGYGEIVDPGDDLSWLERHVKRESSLHLVTREIRERYRIIRNAASHPGQFSWLPQTNSVSFKDSRDGQYYEFDIDDYHRHYRRFVLFCELGVRGILCAYCDRARDAQAYELVRGYFRTFPEDYRAGIPGYCIPYG